MKKLYLAYGSNLDHSQMMHRCPEAEYVGPTEVKDHELIYRGNNRDYGVATIEPKLGENVPACVWRISKADEAALDRYEGWPVLYIKRNYKVEVNGEVVEAMAYIMTAGHRLAKPSPYYYGILRRGYKDCKLDLEYLRSKTSIALNASR